MVKKIYTKDQILAGMKATLSVRACARNLGCSYQHLKKWMKIYYGEDGRTLFEIHKNPHGKGINKWLGRGGKEPPLIELIEGRLDISSFTPAKIKSRLIIEGLLQECCANCGFCERRVVDFKIPLLLHFKDKNKKNYRKENISLLCYNCYFLYYADIFSDKEIIQLEDHVPNQAENREVLKFELDPYQQEQLEKLGLSKPDTSGDAYSLVSYTK